MKEEQSPVESCGTQGEANRNACAGPVRDKQTAWDAKERRKADGKSRQDGGWKHLSLVMDKLVYSSSPPSRVLGSKSRVLSVREGVTLGTVPFPTVDPSPHVDGGLVEIRRSRRAGRFPGCYNWSIHRPAWSFIPGCGGGTGTVMCLVLCAMLEEPGEASNLGRDSSARCPH